MSTLDVILVLAFTLPLVAEWVQRQNCFDSSGLFVMSMVVFFIIAHEVSIRVAGIYSLGLVIVLWSNRNIREMRTIDAEFEACLRLNAEMQLAVALTSLTRDLLQEDLGLDFDDKSDPFVVAMRDMSNIVFKVVFDRTHPVSQAR